MKRERINPVLYLEVDNLFEYNTESCTGLVWKHQKRGMAKPKGSPAGRRLKYKNNGIWMVSSGGKHYKVHRVVYSLFFKVDLTEKDFITHKDGNGYNNSIDNLELVTCGDNDSFCNLCKKFKTKDNFSTDNSIKNGCSIYCKDCKNNGSIKDDKYHRDFSALFEYSENVDTKLLYKDTSKLVGRAKANGVAGSSEYGIVFIDLEPYSIPKIVLSMHNKYLEDNENIKYLDGNFRNYSINNLEIVEKQDSRKAKISAEYQKTVKHNAEYELERRMAQSAKERATKYGLDYDITYLDIIIPECCPILGIELKRGKGKVCKNSPSLDRIVPSKGYTKDNIMVISHRANSMKSDASKEDLLTFAKWVFNEYA